MRKKRTIIDENIDDDKKDLGAEASDIICVLSKVYKINTGVRSFCFQTVEPVDEPGIQVQYPNGGKFIVVEFNGLGETINTVVFDIEPKPMAVTTTPNGNNIPGDFQLRLLMDEIAWTRQMLMQMITGNGRNTQTPIGELVQAMQGLNGLAGHSNPVDLIIKGMDIGVKANGGTADWKTSLLETVKEVAPQVMQVLKPQPQPSQITTGQPTMTPETAIKFGIAWLKPKIIAGFDPALAVGWLVQNANDPQYQPMLAMAVQGNIDTFIGIDPEIANEPYRGWFTVTIQEIKDWYAEQQQPPDDSTDLDGGNGNGANVASNANNGSRKPHVTKVS